MQMQKDRMKFVIPTMVIVAIGAIFMLVKYYSEVPTSHKVLIVISATLFSGILSHGMFANNVDDVDPKDGPVKKIQKSKSKKA